MKRLKKTLALMLCTVMTVMMCGVVSFAAGGQLRFSDPSTTVGATVEITAKLSADDSLGAASATLSYDSQYLKFVSGDGATDKGGQIELTGDGGGSTEMSWTLQFQALAEGTTQITIASVSAEDSDGASVSVTEGNSTVTIGEGDPSLIQTDESDSTSTSSGGGGTIEIDGQSYTVSTDIPDVLIPDGFVKADLTYNGKTYAATKQEVGSVYAIYLKDSNDEEDFWLYDPDQDSFSPFEQISISDTRYIILLSEDRTKDLPDSLQKTTMTVEGKEFPAWQNTDASSYYVVYALNSDGEKGYYQYDTVDETYQRYTPDTQEDTEQDTGKLGGILNKLKDNLDKVILVAWGIFLVMLLVLIILAVKLRHRNLELDDLYEEYDIDDEAPEKESKADKKAKKKAEKEAKKAKKAKKKSEDEFDDYDDYDDEEDFDELDEPEDEYEDDELDEDDYDEEPFSEYDASDYEDDSEIDDLDEILNARVRVKRTTERSVGRAAGREKNSRRVGHAEDDDTFKMDLIDLD